MSNNARTQEELNKIIFSDYALSNLDDIAIRNLKNRSLKTLDEIAGDAALLYSFQSARRLLNDQIIKINGFKENAEKREVEQKDLATYEDFVKKSPPTSNNVDADYSILCENYRKVLGETRDILNRKISEKKKVVDEKLKDLSYQVMSISEKENMNEDDALQTAQCRKEIDNTVKFYSEFRIQDANITNDIKFISERADKVINFDKAYKNDVIGPMNKYAEYLAGADGTFDNYLSTNNANACENVVDYFVSSVDFLGKHAENPFCMQRIKDIKDKSNSFFNNSYGKVRKIVEYSDSKIRELKEECDSKKGFFGFFRRIPYKFKISREEQLREKFSDLLVKIGDYRSLGGKD
jgi:hypothetical protein